MTDRRAAPGAGRSDDERGSALDGLDRSVGGAGNMLVRAASTVTLADARGPELDQGAADRYRDEGGHGVLTAWAGDSSDLREVDGVKVPFRVGATWYLPSGPLRYAAWEVEQVELVRREP